MNQRVGRRLRVHGIDSELEGPTFEASGAEPPLVHSGDEFLASVEANLPQLLDLLRSWKGYEFANYELERFAGSVQRRMERANISSVADYCKRLASHDAEPEELFQDLVVGTTCFFRDGDAWDGLSHEVARSLQEIPEGDVVRAWVPACSTGEDAFSVAMVLQETFARRGGGVGVRVFATDINDPALEYGRRAVYPASIRERISRERLGEFFSKRSGVYRIRSLVRQTVVFGHQNVLTDPPVIKADVIVCRNLLTYVDAETRARVLSLFHYALRTDGVLFLGDSEAVGGGDLFAPARRAHSIYRKTEGSAGHRAFVWPILVESSVRRLRRSNDAGGSAEPGESLAAGEPPPGLFRSPIHTIEDVRDRLRAARTAAIPELLLADQGLRSAIEELVSANEQLETSTEEITSLNEELQLTNAALRDELDSLTTTQDELSNLMHVAGLSAVVVSRDLRILRFTEAVRSFLPLRQADLGRPLSDLTSVLEYDRFIEDALEVIETLGIKEAVTKMGDTTVLVRMGPYRTGNRIDGVVIAFVDVDALMQPLRAARESGFIAPRDTLPSSS